jgi:RHS repeat-associated protein
LKNWIFLNLNRPSIPNNDLIDIAIISEAITQPFLYTGREYDRATGLCYYRARYYDAETGTFTQEDPVIPPFLVGLAVRLHAACFIFSFWAGVIPPMPILGR